MSTSLLSASNNTVGGWLKAATAKLRVAGINTARLDCLILLEDELGKDRVHLLAHPETIISSKQYARLNKNLSSRCKHLPLAYIRGKTEFYGRVFLLNKSVLEPRPESETMIDELKGLPLKQHAFVADIGTGSGALAITAKLELPQTEVIGTDIDAKCLKVAKENTRLYKLEVDFFKGDLIASVKHLPINVVLANLPYVPNNFKINQAAMNEPRIAIFGGPDGLNLYRRLFGQIDFLKLKPKYILTESLPPQHKKLAQIAAGAGYKLFKTNDFIQVFAKGQ